MSWKNDYLPLLRLVIPLIFAGMIGGLVYFFLSLFLSKLGSETLAAGSLVSWLYSILVVISFGILGAINILISHLFGQKRLESIVQVVRDALLLSLLLSVPAFILFWNMDTIFIYLGQSLSVVKLALPFLHALAFAFVPYFIFTALIESLIGLGHTRAVIFFTFLTVSLSIYFSYLLIFGSTYIPQLGISGAGWGIALSYTVTLGFLILYLFLNQTYTRYFLAIFNLKSCKYLSELFKIGIPLGLMYCVEVGYFFALTIIIGRYGHELLAANQVAMQFLGPLIGGIFSIAQAITVRIGHLMGSKHYCMLNRAVGISLQCSVFFVLIFSCIYWFYPKWLISFDFTLNEQNAVIMHHATSFLYLAGIFQILEAIRVALFGALRALKASKLCLICSLVTFWLIGLPIGIILENSFILQGKGIWFGAILGALISIPWLWFYLRALLRNPELLH